MSTQSFCARHEIVGHIEKGELHLAFPLIAELPDASNRLGHLILVLEYLEEQKRVGVKSGWGKWFDAQVKILSEQFLELAAFEQVVRAIELFHSKEGKIFFASLLDDRVRKQQAKLRATDGGLG